MGCWSVSCGISNIAIVDGQECCIVPIKESHHDYGGYVPASLPIFGKYNDYGSIENIIENDNTKLIEEFLGITIQEFVTFLVDGKFTYEREEAKEIENKLEKNDKLKFVENLRFMWIDKQVYDYMSINHTHESYSIELSVLSKTFGLNSYDLPNFYERFIQENPELKETILKDIKINCISSLYFNNLDLYKFDIIKMSNIRLNMWAMSTCWLPYKLYLTPQCGEFEIHQKLLNKFAKINKSYING